jgi:triphosphoribosyl-dephospho-CoA synthase
MTEDADPDLLTVERGPAANAELAMLLEVAGTPKPGNVDRHRDFADLRFEHFLAGAVGAREGLERAASGGPLGEAFETAVAGMAQQQGDNTQFGCLLLLVPLVAATVDECGGRGDHGERGNVSPEAVRAVCEATTVADAAGFYRAFEYVDVAVEEPPEELEPLDVRRGAAAVPTLRDRETTLWDVMRDSADHDGNAREWVDGFPRTFAAAESLLDRDGPLSERVAWTFLDLLAEEPDTLIRTQHGEETAREIQQRAGEIDSLTAAEEWAEELTAEGINPGTTADLTAAAIFVALQRGMTV